MKLNQWTLTLVAAGVIGLTSAGAAHADEQDLVNRIKVLEKRIAELEGKKGEAPEKKDSPVEAWLGATKFSGFASASYLYNFNHPASDKTMGRSFDVNHGEFALNKLKLMFEKSVEYSGEKWDAGYRADLI